MNVKEVLPMCEEFLSTPRQSYNFLMLFKDGDKIVAHPRDRNPCYGELRTYHPGEYRPSDLHWPFPKEGIPTMLCVPLYSLNKYEHKLFFCPDTSPWKSVFEGRLHVIKTPALALLLTDGDFDPTVMVHWLKNQKVKEKFSGITYKQGILPSVQVYDKLHTSWLTSASCTMYTWPVQSFSFRKFVTGTPTCITPEGKTWAERGDYNRKDLHTIWSRDNDEDEDPDFYKEYKKIKDKDKRLEFLQETATAWMMTS